MEYFPWMMKAGGCAIWDGDDSNVRVYIFLRR